jgi:geranylgeranylglyceryl phosphate synthase family protein
MSRSILDHMLQASEAGKKQLAVLIDPDMPEQSLQRILKHIQASQADYIFLGGSLLHTQPFIEQTLEVIKSQTDIPVILFPGNELQVVKGVDAVLFLSLISGRNPELLIGKHVTAAPYLKKLQLEVLPTGYILIDSGKPTTVSYISQTMPIPSNKPDIAAITAMAGEMLGLKLMYLDGGSGAENTIPPQVVQTVRQHIRCPIIVGGGIKNITQADALWQAGADIIVVGNVLEELPNAFAR